MQSLFAWTVKAATAAALGGFLLALAAPEDQGSTGRPAAGDAGGPAGRPDGPPPGFGGPPGGGGPFGPGGFGPGGFGPGSRGPMGGRGPGGFGGQERKLVKEFDRNEDGRLDVEERSAARASLKNGAGRDAPKPGRRLSPGDVPSYPDAPLYEPTVLRTLFFEFGADDWEAELADFKETDVEVPATLIVDGKTYPQVGMSFRGMSSFGMVPAGYKRSLNVSIDFTDEKQRLYGYKSLNLLNCNNDPSFLRTVLALHVAVEMGLPAPKANLVQVVINGESWGVYANAQQFNKELVAEHYPNAKGSRWKVPGSPGGGGGLDYLGDDPANYERKYELKSDDADKAWPALIELCRVLDETPTDELEAALAPIMDLDKVLKFLAWDVALVNEDGYWVRASDYSLVRSGGKFSLIPHDANETFHEGGGPGMGGPPGFGPPGGFAGGRGGAGGRGFGPGGPGGPGGFPFGPPGDGGGRDGGRRDDGGRDGDRRGGGPGGMGPGRGGPGGMGAAGVELDPLVALDDERKPLRSRLLAVPSLRQRYLAHVHAIAERSLDWGRLGPLAEQYAALIDAEVAADTRKLSTYDAFLAAVGKGDGGESQGTRRSTSLRSFVERRREFLLNHPDVKAADEAENP